MRPTHPPVRGFALRSPRARSSGARSSGARSPGVRSLIAITGGIALLASGCGGGEGTGGENDPILIASLEPMTGSNVLKNYIDGTRMAVEEVNAAGGIMGRKVVLKEYDTAIDPAKSAQAARLAVSDKVDAAIGLPSSIEFKAAAKILQRADIPFMSMGVSTATSLNEDGGHANTYRVMTRMEKLIYSGATYMAEEIKPRTVGLMGLKIDYGITAMPRFQQHFKAAGITTLAPKLYPYDVKDLTAEVLSMKSANAIVDWSYPNQMAVGVRQSQQNGIRVPYMGGPATSILDTRKLVPPEAMAQVYGVQLCNPPADERQYVKDWAQRYQKKYGDVADYGAAGVYDAIFILKAAMEQAKSTEPEKVGKALGAVNHTKGMCATTYKSDPNHEMMNESVIVSYADGQQKSVRKFGAADLAGKG
jgi:branched-chain amino acid transport system substrate-binding protein